MKELRRTLPPLIVALLCCTPVARGQADAMTDPDRLRIDPLLVVEAQAVWRIIANGDNPIWPGWDASDTPILFYLPGVQDVLINHPDPPEGFVPYTGPHTFAGASILVSDGPTWIDWDGQNTSRELNGVETLIVADSLSNLKQTVRGSMHDPRPAEEKLGDLDYEALRTDPYGQMATIAHEAFHVYQERMAPGKGANELNARLYPCLSVENNVAVALEATALDTCLRATDASTARAAAVRWLALRLDRRASLAPEVIAYEDGNEFSEGVAMYIEWRLSYVLEGRAADDALWWAHGFHGFDDLSFMRDDRLERLRRSLRGEININNDRYGMSPVRGRLYYSGMAIAAMLDRFDPDWKSRIFDPDVTLTTLAEAALAPSPEELAAALREAHADPEYSALVTQKEQLAAEGHRDTLAMLEAIVDGPKTSVIIDWAALGDQRSRMSFTPFGVRAVDVDRTIYTLVPIQAAIGSRENGFRQQVPLATLEDRVKRRFQFQLSESVDTGELASRLGAPVDGGWLVDDLDLELPGAQLRAKRARIEHDGRAIRVQLLPADEG
ncbi:MAG: hypothetical protein ACYTGC_03230 [Planctomycetota bacterium]|jgi:hypothetical protein